MATIMIESLNALVQDLDRWDTERRRAGTSELTEILNSISEKVESGSEAYYRLDPDPFDDRHPSIAQPTSSLGHMLQVILDQEDFLNALLEDYLVQSDEENLNVAGCRLLLNLFPALDVLPVLEDSQSLLRNLFHWAEVGQEPLSSYAIGVLAGAMEMQEIATAYSDSNAVLVPILLRRLKELKNLAMENREQDTRRHFSMFAQAEQTSRDSGPVSEQPDVSDSVQSSSPHRETPGTQKRAMSPVNQCESLKRPKTDSLICGEMSNSSWKELEPYVVGSMRIFPLDINIQQRLILQYLTPMAEYQEFISASMEQGAIDLLLHYIDMQKNDDVRLAFTALRYLGSLICSKKFAMEFMAVKGVQKLCQVPRPSVAAAGVAMCFFYLSYFEYNMEKVCSFPEHDLGNLTDYAFWLLECSHNSSRCHATMFFTNCLSYRIFLEIFDEKDGLRRLLNEISTLEILNSDSELSLLDSSFYVKRHCIRKVCAGLKKYFDAHLSQKAAEILQSQARDDGRSGGSGIPPYKPYNLQAEVTQDNIETLLGYLPVRFHWKPVNTFLELSGIKLLLQLLTIAANYTGFNGKVETMQCSLDVLAVCTTLPKAQLELLELMPNQQGTQGIGVIVSLAEGEVVPDKDIQKSALRVLLNCVCGPMETIGGGVGRYNSVGSRKMVNMKGRKEVLQKMWESVRSNNGIMVLLKLLSTKVPITHADHIRTLACKALVGLSRSETVRQIMSKLPLFTDNQLRVLMKEPVLEEREHVNFCKFANQLLEAVTGKFPTSVFDQSVEDIRRADIVAQTKIFYPQKELLQLIYEHLLSKGYTHIAGLLQKEANLPERSIPEFLHPSSTQIYANYPTKSIRMNRQLSHPSTSGMSSSATGSRSGQHHQPTPSVPQTPIRINLAQSRSPFSPMPPVKQLIFTPPSSVRLGHERGTPHHAGDRNTSSGWESNMNLDRIVTEFLRKQHALCPNPVSTCPPMSLFEPHRCPVPLKRRNAPKNITSRYLRKQWQPRHGGTHGALADRKFIYSRFRFNHSYRDQDDQSLSCCKFSPWQSDSVKVDRGHIILGNTSGVVRFYHSGKPWQSDSVKVDRGHIILGNTSGVVRFYHSGKERLVTKCHTGEISNVEQSKDSKLLLTTGLFGEPLSSLWSVGTELTNRFNFQQDNHVEFSHMTQDRIVGTMGETAHIYDVGTGECVVTLCSEKSNHYESNKATFSPNDDMVLNDGILWDVRSASIIHRFDKFNPNISGVFHPHGLEVIINSEVWDLRKYHLLRMVPALDQFDVRFNNSGDVLYGAVLSADKDVSELRNHSIFRTFDAIDYTNIATVDLKRNIKDICMDNIDGLMALIEDPFSGENLASSEPNACRFYEIGQQKDDEEGDDEAEEEEEEDNIEEEEDEDEESTLEILSVGDSANEYEDEEDFQGGDRSGQEDVESDDGDGNVSDDVDLDDDMRFELVE